MLYFTNSLSFTLLYFTLHEKVRKVNEKDSRAAFEKVTRFTKTTRERFDGGSFPFCYFRTGFFMTMFICLEVYISDHSMLQSSLKLAFHDQSGKALNIAGGADKR